jgi:hypothetical protein
MAQIGRWLAQKLIFVRINTNSINKSAMSKLTKKVNSNVHEGQVVDSIEKDCDG